MSKAKRAALFLEVLLLLLVAAHAAREYGAPEYGSAGVHFQGEGSDARFEALGWEYGPCVALSWQTRNAQAIYADIRGTAERLERAGAEDVCLSHWGRGAEVWVALEDPPGAALARASGPEAPSELKIRRANLRVSQRREELLPAVPFLLAPLLLSHLDRARRRRWAARLQGMGRLREVLSRGRRSRAAGEGAPQALAPFAAGLALVALAASIQLVLHPGLSGGSLRTWGLYWAYTVGGVILPGTLLALGAVRWRADPLTWIGLGWALGHGLELLALLVAKALGEPRLFALWTLPAFALGWSRRASLKPKVEAAGPRALPALAIGFLFATGALLAFALGLPEISTAPPYISDVWFHVGNARELRDHWPLQDPRLAGEGLNYHVFGYAPAAAASLVTGEPIAPLLTRHAGTSAVFLLTLNLVNAGRAFGGGRLAAGAIGALLILVPLDLGKLLSERFAFGSAVQLFGVYVSTTTLAGHVFLSAFLVVLPWHLRGLRWRDHWMLALLAFAGAGAKAMFGPVVLSGAIGLCGFELLRRRRIERRSLGLALLLGASILPPLLPMLVGEDSYAPSAQLGYGSFASFQPFYREAVRLGMAAWLARSLWLPGFSALFLAGGALALGAARRDEARARQLVFVWGIFLASLVPAMSLKLGGGAQLFFLYYGNAALACVAGQGLLRAFPLGLHASLLLWFAVQLAFDLPFSVSVGEAEGIWIRSRWWREAVTERTTPSLVGSSQLGRLGPYGEKLFLTEDIRRGLEWARRHLPPDAVFAANVDEASPLGAWSERRAFFETARFHAASHANPDQALPERFRWRFELVESWRRGDEDAVEKLRSAGITHLFEDLVNGQPVPRVAGLGEPVFANADFRIYELGRGAEEP